MTARPALLATALLAACGDPLPAIDPPSVVTLTVCPDDSVCEPVADGRSLLTLELCVPPEVKDRRPDLQATIRISDGTFQITPDGDVRTLTQKLGASGCLRPTFRTGTAAGFVRVEAELLEFQVSDFVLLSAAPIVDLVPSADPAVLQPDAVNQVKISAEAVAAHSGQVTAGTRLSLRVVEPADAAAYILPASVELAGARGETTLVAGPSVDAITVELTATPPAVEGGDNPLPFSTRLTLQVID